MARQRRGSTPAILALQDAGVDYSVHAYAHDPAAASFGREAAEALGVDPALVFKTLLCEVDGDPVVAIVPVIATLDLKALAAVQAGKRATLMDGRAAERTTGYVLGGISPFGQRVALPTVLDISAQDRAVVYVSGGRRGLDIAIAPEVVIALTGARVARIATA